MRFHADQEQHIERCLPGSHRALELRTENLAPPAGAAQFTLRKFHQAIQIAMGWRDEHLHEFRVGKQTYGEPDEDNDPYGITRRKDDRHVLLSELLHRVGSKAFYTYDFGDSWEHQITFEKRRKFERDVIYPVCIAGEMACPPEDCGGIHGYYALIEALADPHHHLHAEMMAWVDGDYQPEERFSIEEINRVLQKPKRARR